LHNYLILFNTIIAFGGWMLAIWFKLYLPFGDTNTHTFWQADATFLLLASVLGSHALAYLNLSPQLAPHRQFRISALATLMSTMGMLLLLSHIEPLQVLYFMVSTAGIALFTIALPGRLRQSAYLKINILDNLRELYQKRNLMKVWLKYRIEDRYAQTFIGILWIVLLPLSTSAVLAFAFSELLGADRLINGASWVTFLLSGLAVFTIFQTPLMKAKTSIVSSRNIIGKVYFPREILIILVIGETLIDFFFVFMALVVINITQGIYPNWHYIFLPVPIIILVVFSAGLAFFIAWISLIIRDLQQLISVVLQLLFYIVVLYSPELASADYAPIINLIPITMVVAAVRDIVLFNQTPDFVSLYYPLVTGIVMLYFGYVYFKVNEDRFMDFV